MQKLKFQNRDEWLLARRGKITGTRLGKIVSVRGPKKIAFYELIAERIAVEADDEDPMNRGLRLEGDAIERFTKETKKKVNSDLVIWARDDDDNIALSPDGSVVGDKEAVEVKCLASARHLEALIEKKIPKEYVLQTIQYFVVNENLQTLHVIFYDPRVTVKEYFTIEIKRKDVQEDVDKYLEYQRETLAEVNEIVNELTF